MPGMPWIVGTAVAGVTSNKLFPVAGKRAIRLIRAVDAFGAGIGSSELEKAIDEKLLQENAPLKLLGEAFKRLGGEDLKAWFVPVSTIEDEAKQSARILGWPDLLFEEEFSPDFFDGQLTFTIDASGGTYLLIDKSGDSGEDDIASGPSGRLYMAGGLGLAVRSGITTELTDGLNLGVSGSASVSGKESAEWGLQITRPNLSAASIAVRTLAQLDARPDDYVETFAQLSKDGDPVDYDGVCISQLALRRDRKWGAAGQITIPFQIKMVSGKISGSAKFNSSKQTRLEITAEAEGLVIKHKGETLLTDGMTLGLSMSVGLASFNIPNIQKLAKLLGGAETTLSKIEAAFGGGANRSLLKPGNLVSQKIREAIQEELGVSGARALLATELSVPADEVEATLSELLVDALDELVDVYSLKDHTQLRARLVEATGVGAITPAIGLVEKAAEKAFSGLEDLVNDFVGELAKQTNVALAGLLGADKNDVENIEAKLRWFLNRARRELKTILDGLTDDMEFSVGVQYSREYERRRRQLSLAEFLFRQGREGSDGYRRMIREPNEFLTDYVEGRISDADIDERSCSIKRQLETTTKSIWTFKILSYSVGRTTEEIGNVWVERTAGGLRVLSVKGGVIVRKTSGEKSRAIELSNFADFAKEQNGSVDPEDRESDGIKIRLVNNEPVDLDVDESKEFLDRLVAQDVVSRKQVRGVLNGIGTARGELRPGVKLGGTISVELVPGEDASVGIFHLARRDPTRFRQIVSNCILKNDKLFRTQDISPEWALNRLADEPGFSINRGPTSDVLATLTEDQLREIIWKIEQPLRERLGDDWLRVAASVKTLERIVMMRDKLEYAFVSASQLIEDKNRNAAIAARASDAFKDLDDWARVNLPLLSRDEASPIAVLTFKTIIDLVSNVPPRRRPPVLVTLKMGTGPQSIYPYMD